MSKRKIVDGNLVEKILKQGQKLRNAMIGSILKNDPFNTEIIYKNYFNTPETSRVRLSLDKNENLTSFDEKRLEAFIKGECMTREEEKLALDTLRSLSAPDLCRTTERSLQSTSANNNCGCYTCKMYNSTYLNCDLSRRSQFKTIVDPESNPYHNNELTRDIQEKYTSNNLYFLKYVDSLKISISSFTLNENGNEKVSFNDKAIYNFGQSFFIEFQVPDQLFLPKNIRSKPDNYVRFCSKKVNNIINFKQITIHSIKSLDQTNLSDCVIDFKISYRNSKQKNASLLGCANFNFASFLVTKNLTCSRALAVFLNNTPINVGTLKVSLQLGCGNLYFGQEFIDAITSSIHQNSIILDSDDSASNLVSKQYILKDKKPKESQLHQPTNKKKLADKDGNVQPIVESLKNYSSKETQSHVDGTTTYSKRQLVTNVKETQTNLIANVDKTEKEILFGFLYISEAQYLNKPTNTYLTCKPFCQTETSISKVITNSYNPVFNFFQLIPLIFDNDLLLRLRENYMVIEFWQKEDTNDSIIGLTKIPLHQFYLAYRNPIIIKYLSKNRLPIIGTDWYEPIYTPDKEEILGQVQILIALGTEKQIINLKSDRGFTSNFVTAKFPPFERKHSKTSQKLISSPKEKLVRVPVKITSFCDQATNTSITPIRVEKNIVTKLDVGMQSDLDMEQKNNTKEKASPTQDMLGSLLSLMSQRQQNIHVENSTNTEPIRGSLRCNDSLNHAQNKTDVELKKTTDLLDTLQKALSLDSRPKLSTVPNKPDYFKASIAINSANHLPSRRKCKAKKSRNRSLKHDDNILPSCYVTFETTLNGDLKVTPVVTRSTSPSWNFKCNVNLPFDLLTNSQKRLIFKVWKKSTNTVTVPNMQTDVVLGFAAIDLTILVAGFPNVQGWYNIIDFSGKCNGQINIHVTPLENLNKYQTQNDSTSSKVELTARSNIQQELEDPAEPSELLSRTLKRKFIELDEITQRLRLRLSKVTNEDSDTSSDGVTDEFEKDINTLSIEEDFDLINFEEEARKLSTIKENSRSENSESSLRQLLTSSNEIGNKNYNNCMQVEDCAATASGSNNDSGSPSATSSKTSLNNDTTSATEKSLDQHFHEGKQKINTLLEKLTLLSAEANSPFTSRYVSGCSMSNEANSNSNLDMEAILKELDHSSRPNIQSSLGFNPLKFQQLYGDSSFKHHSKSEDSSAPQTSNSNTSLITNFSDCRPAPDGEGNISDEVVSKITK